MATKLKDLAFRTILNDNRDVLGDHPIGPVGPRFNPDLVKGRQMRQWLKWATKTEYGQPGKPENLGVIDMEYVEKNQHKIPFHGLREYWYPVCPSRDLKHNKPKPERLLGDNLVFFRDSSGVAAALADECPHRQTLLSLGGVGIYEPGTITCAYHGWTFDGEGNCVAAITDGPNSPLCGRVKARAYPTEEKDGLIWVYMGEKSPPPVYEQVTHAEEVLAGPWKYFNSWDWPINYLSSLDNDMDVLHPGLIHRGCVQFKDQPIWGHPTSEVNPCGGLNVGLEEGGPEPRGPRASQDWEFHLPGYLHFPGVPPIWPDGNIFWAVPLDLGHMRTFTFTSFRGPIRDRAKRRLQHGLMWSKYGFRSSIYYCNMGPDQAMMAGQGRVADRTKETLARSDRCIVKMRRMMEDAHARELEGRRPSSSPGDEHVVINGSRQSESGAEGTVEPDEDGSSELGMAGRAPT